MKNLISAVTSAALIVLAGPALAGKSTPQEREATKQLNLEAAQQAKNTNQQLAAASPNNAAPAQTPAAAPTTPVDTGQAAQQSNSPAAAAPSPAGNSGITPPAQ